jgi:hypothetical protein
VFRLFSQQNQILMDPLYVAPVVHRHCVVHHESLIRLQNGFEFLVRLAYFS